MARLFDDASSQRLDNAAAAAGMPFTMACWFRTNDDTANQCLMSIGAATSDNNWSLEIAGGVAGDPVRVGTRAGGAATTAVTSTGFTNNTWHHACGVFTSATARSAFIDGGSKGTDTTSRTPTGANTTSVGVRTQNVDDRFFSGDIAEAVIWNVALTDAEVAVLATGVDPWSVRPGAIVAMWRLWGNSSPEPDMKGSFPLTLTTAPSKSDHPRIYYIPRRFILGPAATAALNGTLTATLGSLTSSAAGTLDASGAASITLGALTSSAAGTLAGTGTASPTLGALTSSAAGVLDIQGTLGATLGALTGTGAGELPIAGTGSGQLGALVLAAAGESTLSGAAAITLGSLTSSGSGTIDGSGAADMTLGALTSSGTGALLIQGTGAVTLSALALVGAGLVTVADIPACLTLRIEPATVMRLTAEPATVMAISVECHE